MNSTHLGELAAITTAICWTITPIAFQAAGKRVGSLSVNFIRLVIAFFVIGIFTLFTRGMFLPLDATAFHWSWLFVSGMIGFVIGDYFLFQSYLEIGSRIAMLIMATSPPITALIGFIVMGETLTLMDLLGMLVTTAGIAMVIFVKGSDDKKIELSHPIKGLTYAFIGAVCQGLGLVLSKYGMGSYNPFAATQIRIIAGLLGFAIVITATKNWDKLLSAVKDHRAIAYISVGAFFGPFLGVSLSLLAVQYIATGIASTITSITPVLIIPASIFIFKEKVTPKEIIGAFVTIIGITILFL